MASAPTANRAELTANEQEFLGQALTCLKGPLEIDLDIVAAARGIARKSASNTWGAIKKKLDDKTALSASEMAFLKDLGPAMKKVPEIDSPKLAQMRGIKPKSTSNTWGAIKKKLFSGNPKAAPATGSPSANEDPATPVKKTAVKQPGGKKTAAEETTEIAAETDAAQDADANEKTAAAKKATPRKKRAAPTAADVDGTEEGEDGPGSAAKKPKRAKRTPAASTKSATAETAEEDTDMKHDAEAVAKEDTATGDIFEDGEAVKDITEDKDADGIV